MAKLMCGGIFECEHGQKCIRRTGHSRGRLIYGLRLLKSEDDKFAQSESH